MPWPATPEELAELVWGVDPPIAWDDPNIDEALRQVAEALVRVHGQIQMCAPDRLWKAVCNDLAELAKALLPVIRPQSCVVWTYAAILRAAQTLEAEVSQSPAPGLLASMFSIQSASIPALANFFQTHLRFPGP